MYKLLIVDDEAMIRKGLSRIIKWNFIGFELVGAVGHAQAALEILNETEIDVLLTDISMPEMSGLDLIRTAREKNPRLRSVIISGYSEFDYAVEALQLRVETYILKPLDPQKITDTFHKLKADMDNERRQAESAVILQAKYELMRLLSSDMRMLRSVFGNQREEKMFMVILIQLILEKSEAEAFCRSYIESRLIHEFYRTTGNLIAVFTFSSRVEELTKDLSEEFVRRGISYRIAGSRKVSELSELMTLYLDTAEELKRVPLNTVNFCPGMSFKKDGLDGSTFLTEFIEAAEGEKQENFGELTDRLFYKLARLNGERAYSVCVFILQGMIFYFKLQGIRLNDFSEPDSEKFRSGEGLSLLKAMFDRTLSQILNQLKENSESLAVMVSYRARQYVNENYSDKELSLKYVANLLNVSYSYLSTEFARTFGENFKTYLVNVRLEKARELLMTRRYKIYEIAELAGYGSSRYFTDAFKKKYGISPVEYLNRLHQGLQEEI